jgi:alkaline phosphatase
MNINRKYIVGGSLKRSIFALTLFCLVSVFAASAPKYIFLFIGDGMSIPQRMVAEEFSLKTGHGPLAMNQMPYQANTRTKSSSSIITDSAAAATAIACGEKTNNRMLGVRPDGSPIESVAHVAKKAGMKVGIITTVTIIHATPAGFYAHRPARGLTYQIALDLVSSGFDYFAGGGVGGKHNDKNDPEYRGDVFDLARKAGYQVVKTREEWASLKPGSKSWSIFADGAMDFSIDSDGSQPSIKELLEKGIEVLDNENGFFIMCEGGKVDYAGHANDAATNVRDILALDEAVKAALKFQKKHPEETLVIVTGDHETGGMSLGFAGTGGKFKVELLEWQKCSTESFSSTIKKMLKENINLDFEKVKPLVTENFGLVFGGDKDNPMRVKSAELTLLKEAFENDRNYVKRQVSDTTAHDVGRKYMFASTVRTILAAHAGIGWSSGSHTALPTSTTAQGACADIIIGMQENTDIGIRLKKLIAK